MVTIPTWKFRKPKTKEKACLPIGRQKKGIWSRKDEEKTQAKSNAKEKSCQITSKANEIATESKEGTKSYLQGVVSTVSKNLQTRQDQKKGRSKMCHQC